MYCKQVFRLKSLITGTVKPAHKEGWGGRVMKMNHGNNAKPPQIIERG